MPKPKLPIRRGVRVNAYGVIARAVEDGVGYGIMRLFKHRDGDTITEAELRAQQDTLIDAILNDLTEVIAFDE